MKVSSLLLVLACCLSAAEKTSEIKPAAALVQPQRSAFVHPDTSSDASWECFLISDARPGGKNQWTAFRRGFSLDRVPGKAIARIAADSKYWLWVNGQIVCREGGLKRGPTPTDSYFDEVDLRRFLRPGGNTVAVLVWHFGVDGFSHKDSGVGGLVFQLQDETNAALLVSDGRWKARQHTAFEETGEPLPNFRLSESNIRFVAGNDVADWTAVEFDDSAWPAAMDHGRVPSAPWNRLVRRTIPFWKESAIMEYVSLLATDHPPATATSPAMPPPETLPAPIHLPHESRGQVVAGKLPYNAQITPYLEVEAPAGLLIEMRTDNYAGGSANNVRAEYVTRAGRQEFECYGWMNGHNVLYSIPAGVKVLRLGYRETGYATEFAGGFTCDDAFLNRLREKALRTLYLTMRDNYMDCPDRERAQWWGDVVNELGEVSYAFDRHADALTRKAILELVAWQKPDGVLFSPIPAGNWDKDLPLQMLASVGRQGFWTYAFFSGDLETLRKVYPAVKRYLEIWDQAPDGLIALRQGGWPWGDWGGNVDMFLLANVWYYLALQGQLRSAEALGIADDVPWLKQRLAGIERQFERTFWNGKEYRSPDHVGATDDRGNALAVVAGLVPREKFPQMISLFAREEHASPYMEKYVLEALCLMDEPALAQARMKRRYAKMVDHPDYSTLWEGWGIGSEGFGGGTINHAWSGGPLTIMSQYFAGISPTAPAFAAYRVFPQPGQLKTIDCRVVTHFGMIEALMKWGERSFSLVLESPPKTLATVGLPVGSEQEIRQVRLNGKVIWTGGKVREAPRGVRSLGRSRDGRLCFEVPAGKWLFESDLASRKQD